MTTADTMSFGGVCILQTSQQTPRLIQIMAKPFIDFGAVKSAVSFQQVLDHYGFTAKMRSTRNGDGMEGSCPFHPDVGKDTFKVTLSKNCWFCHHITCKCGGNHLDFVSRMENCDAHEAALKIDQWFNLGLAGKSETSSSKHDAANAKPAVFKKPAGASQKPAPKTEEPNDEAESDPSENQPLSFTLENLKTDHEYLIERGLIEDTVREFGLGFCAKGTMSGRIVIPIHNPDGTLIGYAGRWPGPPPEGRPKYKLPNGFHKSAEVFNLHRAVREGQGLPLVVVEGFFDVIKLWQLGFHRVVSLMGCSLSAKQEAILVEASSSRSGIVLMFDEDDAGRAGREKALLRLANQIFVRVVPLPEAGSQPEHLSADELHNLLD